MQESNLDSLISLTQQPVEKSKSARLEFLPNEIIIINYAHRINDSTYMVHRHIYSSLSLKKKKKRKKKENHLFCVKLLNLHKDSHHKVNR
jgi:hypothetical protein